MKLFNNSAVGMNQLESVPGEQNLEYEYYHWNKRKLWLEDCVHAVHPEAKLSAFQLKMTDIGIYRKKQGFIIH